MNTPARISLLIGIVFAVGCAGASKKKYRPIDEPSKQGQTQVEGARVEEPADERLQGPELEAYNAIKSAFLSGDYPAALKNAIRFQRRYKRSKKIAQVYNFQGLVYLRNKKMIKAIHRFKKAIAATSPEKSFVDFVRYNLATAQYEAKQLNEAQSNLERVRSENLNYKTRIKFHFLRSVVNSKLGLTLDSARELLASSYLLQSRDQNKKYWDSFQGQLERNLDELGDRLTLEALFSDYDDSPMVDIVIYRLGLDAKSESTEKSLMYFRILVSRFPNSTFYEKAAEQLRLAQSQGDVDRTAIGVLIPETGRFAKFGEQVLHAIALAFRIFDNQGPDSKANLIVMDSGDTPEKAIESLNKLYYEHRVVAVLGPLLSKGVDKVTLRAQELGLPMISLAQRHEEGNNFVFPSAVTPQNQAFEIARYAIQKRGMSRFAIAYPDDNFGRQYSKHFWDAVESLGGEIVGVEKYTPNSTDFRKVVDRLGGLYYKEARSRELEALKALRERDGIKKRNRRTEEYFKLKPIYNFEAVFIPDEARTVAQALPTFEYRDIENVAFLGVSTWNSNNLFERAPEADGKAFFVDSFFSASQSSQTQNFIRRFKKTYGRLPRAIDAIAFDAAALLERTLITATGEMDRYDVRDRIKEITAFPGVTGTIKFENGRLSRELKVLTYRDNRFIEASDESGPIIFETNEPTKKEDSLPGAAQDTPPTSSTARPSAGS